ncbi:MAG TPA: F0F1 ATP synthase subunit A [Terracidiphilus sp.]|nr:F0F1 ATP synthase subunit A [Terracidiphilus sp.]
MLYSLGIAGFLNHWFGGAVASILHAVGLKANPASVFNDTFSLELLVACGLLLFFILVRLSLSVENPGAMQQVAEMIHEFTANQGEQVIGHEHERFQAFTTCVVLFVLFNNFLGLIPRTVTPTSQPVVPLGIAVLTFLYYNFHGVRSQGPVGYLKHFAGPLWWLSPLLFPIEVISHFARVMSLTIRLYANMLASDLLTLVAFSMIPLAIPVLPLLLHFAVSTIQAYVFMLLAMIYLSQAVAHEH